ncbi:MAG: rRNA maturation RNase YbeY [Muribaculaceae bacterium]|nr:rRNA maturation RNase YbeY [Muribaculaceae bacterium]
MLNSFSWYNHDVLMPALDFERVERWLQEVAATYEKKIGQLSYIFCNDEEILRVNRQFLQHDYYTDIITFDNTHGRVVSGDMFISLDTVSSNATDVSHEDYNRELLRVVVHGLLHLCGINDKGPGEREIMEECENRALTLYNAIKQ